MEQGWIRLYRKFIEHPLYREKRCFSKAEAWIDLLLTVNYRDHSMAVGNESIEIKRGSKITSIIGLRGIFYYSNTK